MKSFLKYWAKRASAALRALFLLFSGAPPNRAGWESRLLLINLEALGDLVAFTSVLKHYKKAFPDKRIYLLIPAASGLDAFFRGEFADEVVTMDYSGFSGNPWNAARLVSKLRAIGFRTVVNHDFMSSEVIGKEIAVSLGAEEVIGYEGTALELLRPFDAQQERNVRLVRKKIYRGFRRIVPRADAGASPSRYPSVLAHYIALYEAVTGRVEKDYATELPVARLGFSGKALQKFGLSPGGYAVLNINASVAYKRWPLDRYRAVAAWLEGQGLRIVLVGSKKERIFVEEFRKAHAPRSVVAAGDTSLPELVELIAGSRLLVGNDTGTTHIAVALGRPCLTVIGGGQFAMFADYGYPQIHRWAHREISCYGDNWRCARKVPPGAPAPCVSAVSLEQVLAELRDLWEKSASFAPDPADFRTGRLEPRTFRFRSSARRKILYAGLRFENYNPRRLSFEYANFLGTLRALPDTEVVEYPLDLSALLGRRRFNEELVRLAREAKPDIFFAFMYSDELDPAAIRSIGAFAKTVAWFADDQWRLHNYSRFYAPHFTKAVTTWSEAPGIYARYGIHNVIRSQWACNEKVWKPVEAARDIEVSFVGQANPARRRIVSGLRARGVDVWVRGWGWPDGRLSHSEMVEAFSRSRICLNFNQPPSRFHPRSLARIFLRASGDRIVPDFRLIPNLRAWWSMATPQIKARPFEALGCRTFLISAKADDMESFYENGEEIVYYDGTVDDLAKKIHAYRGREEERERIARKGYERTLREHTYAERFEKIFGVLLNS